MRAMVDIRDPKNVDAFMAWYAEKTREAFVEQGEYRPQACVVTTRDARGMPTGGGLPTLIMVLPAWMRNNDEKDAFRESIEEVCVKSNGFAVVLGMESWFATGTEEEVRSGAPTIPVRDRPDRKEGIALSLEHVALPGTMMWIAMIERDGEGKPSLGEFVKSPIASRGRFADILRPLKAGVN